MIFLRDQSLDFFLGKGILPFLDSIYLEGIFLLGLFLFNKLIDQLDACTKVLVSLRLVYEGSGSDFLNTERLLLRLGFGCRQSIRGGSQGELYIGGEFLVWRSASEDDSW